MKEIAKDEFVIKVDYEPNTIEPSKVFKSMAELIESMGSIDRVLLEPFPFINNSQLVLEEIAVGSLMSKLKSSLLSIPDEALGELSIQ